MAVSQLSTLVFKHEPTTHTFVDTTSRTQKNERHLTAGNKTNSTTAE